MTLDELFNITRIVSAFVLLIFTVFLLNRKVGNIWSFRFLAGFLLARVFILVGLLFWSYDLVYTHPQVAYVERPFLFLYAPMLFLYTRSVTKPSYRFKRSDIFHFIPALVITLLLISNYYLSDAEMQLLMITNNSALYPLPANMVTTGLWLQFFLYVPACSVLLINYRNRIKQFHSSIEDLKLSWLVFLLTGFFVWKAIFVTGYLFFIIPRGSFATLFEIFIEFGFLFYASMIVYKALQIPEVFNGNGNIQKYKTSPLKEEDKKRYLEKMESCMTEQQLYRDPLLTLRTMAKKSSIPAHYISQILNESLNAKFYDYVNKYRIEESKKILTSYSKDDKTILEVLYDVGFNSKSVFNTAFKKYVGMTPREFKRSHQN
jgi:AraC-like DNA-binding protein